jgi:DNA-binding transcriptional ArsR family regulator
MKPGPFLLALFLLALLALPLASLGNSDSPGAVDPVTARAGPGHGFRYGGGPGASGDDGRGHGPGPMPQAARQGQERSASSKVQQELQRDPFDWNTTVRSLRFRSYRRLFGKNILEHEKRQMIYSTIHMNPGIDVDVLGSQTCINLHTLRYHLSHLVRTQKITCVEQGGKSHFFENNGRYDPSGQREILYQSYPTTHRILTIIMTLPGITRGEIARRLGLAGPSVTRWMQRLVAEGMVNEEREGRFARYYLSHDMRRPSGA